jgi:hypothetical protein
MRNDGVATRTDGVGVGVAAAAGAACGSPFDKLRVTWRQRTVVDAIAARVMIARRVAVQAIAARGIAARVCVT